MSSIDLYGDFNDEIDAQAGDLDDVDGNRNNSGAEDRNANSGDDGDQKEEVQANVKVMKIKRKLNKLNEEKLKGPRGIIAVDDFFKDVKFKGKGYEKQDLNDVLKRLEHWAHRMYPKYNFDDSLVAIDRLGKKKEIAIHMVRYRMDQLTKDDDVVLSDHEENEQQEGEMPEDAPMDEFEALIDEQIALTTVHSRTNNEKSFGNISGISSSTKLYDQGFNSSQNIQQSNYSQPSQSIIQPQSQQPEKATQEPPLSDEIRARIAENRMKALAIRQQKMKEIEEQERVKRQAERQKSREISNILIDDDDDF